MTPRIRAWIARTPILFAAPIIGGLACVAAYVLAALWWIVRNVVLS